jgi:apolipoprotein N-acyltransferase
LAVAAGALLAASFAPLSVWPLAILCPAVLMGLWQDATPREAARLGFLFNVGTFTAGTYWLYSSVHGLGGAPGWIAVGLMAALVAIMSAYHALLGYAVARWLPRRGAARWLVGMPAAWLLIEWWRGWFLTGFSWLSLGYSQTDTWLAALAPVAGVYGISAVILISAGALVTLHRGSSRERFIALAVLAVPWVLCALLRPIDWTHPSGAPVSVAILQGAVPQDEKWADGHHDEILERYRRLTGEALGARLIVMPEAALPDVANELVDYLTGLRREAAARGSVLVLGALRADSQDHYFNSVLALDERVSWYDKHHLVPFAEFFPVPSFVRSWMRLMNMPYSDITHGAALQPPLSAAGLKLAASVCYEDAYGSSIIAGARDADALVNVTNDAWFGHSSARYQHFQIARMRAIESGRFLIRSANDGLSGVIGPHGEPLALATPYRPEVLRSEVIPRAGATPYARVGNWLVVALAAAALACGLWVRNDRGRATA